MPEAGNWKGGLKKILITEISAMRKFRIGLIVVAIIVSVAELVFIDFSNLALSKNIGHSLTLTGMLFVIISQVFEIRKSQRE